MYICKSNNLFMNRIKEILDLQGVSQTELARLLGKTFNMINLYTTNKVQPPISVLYQIADVLNVDVRDLLIPNKIKHDYKLNG